MINLLFFWHKKKEEVYLTSSHPLEYCSGVHTLLYKVDLYKVSFYQPRSSFIKAVPAVKFFSLTKTLDINNSPTLLLLHNEHLSLLEIFC